MEQLGKHFKTVAKAVLDKHGSAYGELLAQWPVIAGQALAAICVPEQIRWPRATGPVTRGQRLGGTLTIRVLPGRVLEVQYAAPVIMDRLNAYWGYGAVSQIKTVQGPIAGVAAGKTGATAPDPALMARIEGELSGIGEARLRQALARLGANVAGRRRKPPQV